LPPARWRSSSCSRRIAYRRRAFGTTRPSAFASRGWHLSFEANGALYYVVLSAWRVRVGLEDNLWWDDERTALATNPRLVERLVTIARAMGREPASPGLVRDRLAISARPHPEPSLGVMGR
jgi:beta-keto acid cleavage enzyme